MSLDIPRCTVKYGAIVTSSFQNKTGFRMSSHSPSHPTLGTTGWCYVIPETYLSQR